MGTHEKDMDPRGRSASPVRGKMRDRSRSPSPPAHDISSSLPSCELPESKDATIVRLQAELQKTKTSLHETETELQNERERRERAEEKAKRLAADLAKQRDAKASSDKLHVNVGSIVAKSRHMTQMLSL